MGQTAAQEGIRNSGKDAHGSRAASTGWRSVDGNGYDNVVGGVSGRYIDRSPPVMEGREARSCLVARARCRRGGYHSRKSEDAIDRNTEQERNHNREPDPHSVHFETLPDGYQEEQGGERYCDAHVLV